MRELSKYAKVIVDGPGARVVRYGESSHVWVENNGGDLAWVPIEVLKEAAKLL